MGDVLVCNVAQLLPGSVKRNGWLLDEDALQVIITILLDRIDRKRAVLRVGERVVDERATRTPPLAARRA